MFLKRRRCSLSPGVEPDPGAEGREEPHPAGADAPGGGGAPLRGAGTRGHPRQRLHTNLPLQAALFLLLVVGHVRGGVDIRDTKGVTMAIEDPEEEERLAFLPWRRLGAASSRGLSTPPPLVGPAQMSGLWFELFHPAVGFGWANGQRTSTRKPLVTHLRSRNGSRDTKGVFPKPRMLIG